MRKILPLAKITWKEHRSTFLSLVLFNLVIVLYCWKFAPAIDTTSRWQLFYTITLESTFLLGFLLGLFTLSTTLPRDMQEKQIYTLLVRPLSPIDLFWGRVVGAFLLVVLQTGLLVFFLALLASLGAIQSPPSTYRAYEPQGVQVLGSFAKNKGAIYWTSVPEVRWELSFQSRPFFLTPPADFPLIAPISASLVPALVFRGIDLPKGPARVDLFIEVLSPKTRNFPLEIHRKITLKPGQKLVVSLPQYFLYIPGKWRVTLTQKDLRKDLLFSLQKPTLFLRAPTLFLAPSQNKTFYTLVPFVLSQARGAPKKKKKIYMQGGHLVWHFHKIPLGQKKFHLQWTPLLRIANSNSQAVVALGTTPQEVSQIQTVNIQDNQPLDIYFSSFSKEDLYFHVFWTDDKNDLGADLSLDMSGRQRNGAVFLTAQQSGWCQLIKVTALFFLKILLVISCLGVAALFLSRYIVLFFGLAFYLGGHSLSQMREFSRMLIAPPVMESQHSGHSHETVKALSHHLPSLWAQYTSKGVHYVTSFFPDLSRFDFVTPFLYGQYIPPSLLWSRLIYLLSYMLFFYLVARFILWRKEYP